MANKICQIDEISFIYHVSLKLCVDKSRANMFQCFVFCQETDVEKLQQRDYSSLKVGLAYLVDYQYIVNFEQAIEQIITH